MSPKFILVSGLLALACTPLMLAFENKRERIQKIDALCAAIQTEFLEAEPSYFAGPDPWLPISASQANQSQSEIDQIQIDPSANSFTDVVIATVYYQGPRVRWLVLTMNGPNDNWFQTTSYYFNNTGIILKRQRHLENIPLNIQLDESIYFENGKPLKTNYHHQQRLPNPANHKRENKENWDLFTDPNTPEYSSTEDLPLALRTNPVIHLAALQQSFSLRTNYY